MWPPPPPWRDSSSQPFPHKSIPRPPQENEYQKVVSMAPPRFAAVQAPFSPIRVPPPPPPLTIPMPPSHVTSPMPFRPPLVPVVPVVSAVPTVPAVPAVPAVPVVPAVQMQFSPKAPSLLSGTFPAPPPLVTNPAVSTSSQPTLRIRYEGQNQTDRPGSQELLVIDGEREVDDMEMAAYFAQYETQAVHRYFDGDVDKLEGPPVASLEPEKAVTKNSPSELSGVVPSNGMCENTPISASEISRQAEDTTLGRVLASHGLIARTNPQEEVSSDDEDDLDISTFLKGLSLDHGTKEVVPSREPCECDDGSAPLGENDGDKKKPYAFSLVEMEGLPAVLPLEASLAKAGTVTSVLGDTVLVKASFGTKALDIGSVLCLQSRQVLGPISDTFGPVSAPFYVVVLSKIKLDNIICQVGVDVFADEGNSTYVTSQEGALIEGSVNQGGIAEDYDADSDDSDVGNPQR